MNIKLQGNSQKYKQQANLKWREVQFNVGDEVLMHLRKEGFLRGVYNKLKYKKIDLFPYTIDLEEEERTTRPTWDTEYGSETWIRQMLYVQPPEIERILDTQVAKRIRKKEYLQYFVKWKNRPIEDSSWLDARQIEQADYSVEKLMDRSHDFF
eukprot:PITA_25771